MAFEFAGLCIQTVSGTATGSGLYALAANVHGPAVNDEVQMDVLIAAACTTKCHDFWGNEMQIFCIYEYIAKKKIGKKKAKFLQ